MGPLGGEVDESVAEGWEVLGRVAQGRGRVEEALAAYEQVLRWEISSWRGWYLKGLCLATAGRAGEAKRCLDTALEFSPACADAWREKGRLHLEAGEVAAGKEALGRALRLDPHDRKARELVPRCGEGALPRHGSRGVARRPSPLVLGVALTLLLAVGLAA